MINIIKRAKRKEVARITCAHCHSILEYREEDIKSSPYIKNYWIVCPVCEKPTKVNPSKDFFWIESTNYYEDN